MQLTPQVRGYGVMGFVALLLVVDLQLTPQVRGYGVMGFVALLLVVGVQGVLLCLRSLRSK